MRRAVGIALVCAAACGGSGDDGAAFIGVYQVTAHVAAVGQGARIACDAPGTPVATPPFVKLAVDDFFDDPSFIRLSECDDAAGTACTETLITFNPGGPGLIGHIDKCSPVDLLDGTGPRPVVGVMKG